MEVVGGFTYVDVGMVANQAARASAFVVSIDDEEINEDGEESIRRRRTQSSSRPRVGATPTYRSSCSARRTSQHFAERDPQGAARVHPHVRGHAGIHRADDRA